MVCHVFLGLVWMGEVSVLVVLVESGLLYLDARCMVRR